MKKRKKEKKVKIIELSLRDGLQNEKTPFSLLHRYQLVKKLIEAGLQYIELGSFVSPKWVPQMSLTEALVKKVFSSSKLSSSARFSVLVLNQKGMQKVLTTPLKEISAVIACSESFSKKNMNCSIRESFSRLKELIKMSQTPSVQLRVYLSTAFACPYEGKVSQKKVIKLIEKILLLGAFEVSIGDTMGEATPKQVTDLLEGLKKKNIDLRKIAMHFHDRRGTALVNVYASYLAGVRHFDSCLGGIGGCPLIKDKGGNVSTENLVYLFKGMGVPLNIQWDSLIQSRHWMEKKLRRKLSPHLGSTGRKIVFSLFFLLLSLSSFAPSQASGIRGTVSKGMGGAGRAGTEGTEALLLNPATIKYSPPKALGVFYSFFSPHVSGTDSERELGLSFVDNNSSNFFSGSLSAFLLKKDFAERPSVQETLVHLSFAEFVFKKFSLGLSTFHLSSNEKGGSKSKYKQWNISLGLHTFLHRNFSVGFTYENLFPPSSSVPDPIQRKSEMGLGFEYQPFSTLLSRFDVSLPLQSNKKKALIYQVGLQTTLYRFFLLRFGREWDSFRKQRFFTGGLGFKSPKFRLNYALKWTHFKSSSQSFKHSLSIRAPF